MTYGKRSPQVMMYNARVDGPKPRHVMMYSGESMPPQAMMYNTQPDSDTLQPLSMMYGKRSPQVMIYNAINEDDPKPRHVMMYSKESMPPQAMMYNAQKDSDTLQPLSMMYGKRSPQVMMYNARVNDPKPRNVMMYSVKDMPAQAMMYNAQPDVDNLQPLSMMFGKTYPQIIRYNASAEKDGVIWRYVIIRKQEKKQSKQNKLNLTWEKQTIKADSDQWFKISNTLIKSVPRAIESYFQHWKQTISIFGDDDLTRKYFKLKFPTLNIAKVIQGISVSNIFEKLFWPFVYENGVMNQKLGLFGLSGRSVKRKQQKLAFYDVLEKYQTLNIPVAMDKIVYSFNDTEVVDALNRSGLQEMSKEYVDAGFHLYTPDEQTDIVKKVNAAMNLINNTMPELYKVIHQVVACIAFYKAEHPGYAGGTVSSALGVIWQDPRAYREQSVAHYAEQIVHEFIHTSLFLADLVHGTFTDFKLLSMAKVYSPIRHELRDFDKTFHASYVSTGVALFHARAGNWDKARKLAEPLKASVDGLMVLNNEIGVLNDSGTAMLQAMNDFLTVIRL